MFCPVMADLARYERAESRAAAEESATKLLLSERVRDAARVLDALPANALELLSGAMVAAKGKPNDARLAAFDALLAQLWSDVDESMYLDALQEVRERAA